MAVGAIGLDYQGKMWLKIGNDAYRLGPSGSITHDPTIDKHGYQFERNFLDDNGNWIIPTWMGMALKEGSHEMRVSCTGKWFDPNPEHEAWSERYTKVVSEIGEIWEVISKTNQPSERYNRLLKERDTLRGQEPEISHFDRSGTVTSTETFYVNYSPENEYPWTLDGQYNESEDPDYRYYPSGIDPESKIKEMEIEVCYVEMDGSPSMEYSYIDEYTGKSIMYADWDSEEQRKAALESAFKNAKRYIGFPEHVQEWGYTLDLFRDSGLENVIKHTPINRYEGPYPELRFRYSELTGTYDSMKEARKHCKSPSHKKGKYN